MKSPRPNFATASCASHLTVATMALEPIEPRLLFAGATLAGVAWNDLDGDGQFEGGEPVLPNWTLYLDANHNGKADAGEPTTVTGANGAYTFTNLAPGNYLVGEITKPGWRQTYPSVAAPPALTAASAVTDSIAAAIGRASDASQFSTAELDAASGWVIGLTPGTSIGSVVSKTGATGAAATGLLPSTYVLRFPAATTGAAEAARLSQVAGLSFFYPLVARGQAGRFIPNDEYFPDQWNLRNTGQFGGLVGADLNVTPVWDQYQGAGVIVGVVDDGVQYTHPDLAENYDSADSFDFNGHGPSPADPGPNPLRDTHGTQVAGVVAARGNNDFGVAGVAPLARYASLRLTALDATDQQEASALSYHRNTIAIYNNSWGPDDDGKTLEGPGPMTIAAMRDSVALGRGGKGSIYVWAAGNGLTANDNVNYDGYANSRFVIATTALDQFGKQAYYAEPGAAILVATYGGGVTPGVTTTDLHGAVPGDPGDYYGDDPSDYYDDFGGTSATTPMVSGVVALMLQANPALTWRDVKHILVDTARKNDPGDGDWVLNGARHWVNHKYGLGSVDAAAAVQAAVGWTNVAPETFATTGPITVNRTIPDNDPVGLTSSVLVDRLMKVETVEVVFDAGHAFRGDLRVVLTSPDGTQSVLAEKHNDGDDDYNQWTFTSNRHWDEIAKGTWTLRVTDERGDNVGTWNSWRLNIYGTSVTSEHYATLAGNATVSGKNFGTRPLPGARVQSADFAYRSGPNRVVFRFDKDVAPSISADDLEVRNDTTGQILPASVTRVDYVAVTRTATWTFPGLARGLLADGNYSARLKAQQVTVAGGGMLDGNGDGLGGDDYTTLFFQLKGDANHDRAVNDADLRAFFAHQNDTDVTVEEGDFNYDNRVDFRDFQILELAYGNTLAKPVEASAEAAAVLAGAGKASAAKPAPAKPVAVAPPVFGTRPIRRNQVDLLKSAPKLFA